MSTESINNERERMEAISEERSASHFLFSHWKTLRYKEHIKLEFKPDTIMLDTVARHIEGTNRF